MSPTTTLRHEVRKARRSAGLVDVTPSNRADRIEAKAEELTKIRDHIKELETRKLELSAQLLKLVKAEGSEADDGKWRYESDDHRFLVVEGKSTRLDPKRLMKYGVKASIIQKSTVETPFEYVRVDVRKPDQDD